MLPSRERTLACQRVSKPRGGLPGTWQGRPPARAAAALRGASWRGRRTAGAGSENIDCSMTKMNGTRWGVMLFKSLVMGVYKKNVVGWRSAGRKCALGNAGSFAPLLRRLGLPAGSLPQPRQRGVSAVGALLAGQLTTIDSDAHYPEGPLWRAGKLFYVEYAQSNIKTWDGKHATVYWHKDGCGANALIPFNGHLLVACYDNNSLVELDATGKELRMIRADSAGKPFTGPNDFAADGHGGIYFSASGVYDIKAPITGTVLHLAANGQEVREIANLIHYSNGLTLSKDGQHLLVAEMLAGRILSFPIAADGTLGPRIV